MPIDAGSRRPRFIAVTAVGVASTLMLTTPLPGPVSSPRSSPLASQAAAALPVPSAPVALPKKLEKLSPYVPQVSCDPVAKPGVIAFARLVRRTYPTTGSLGFTRACYIGGRSEHKDGRAWDWAVSARNPADAARASALLEWLLAEDDRGKKAGAARRLGIMYIIWNRRIWSAEREDEGWRPYVGSHPHTNHVHFSFSWAGAMRRTSWWTGKVAKTDYGPCPPKDGGPAPKYDGPNHKRCKADKKRDRNRKGD